MSGGKLSPRQKMINMMYLVLIALLAMNVSKEILKAFHLMDVSFTQTGKSLNAKMQASINGIEAEVAKQGEKAKPYAIRAVEARKLVDELTKYLDEQSAAIVTLGGGRVEKDEMGLGIPELAKPDDTEKHANYFSSESRGLGNGIKLRQKIEQTRIKLAALLKATPGDTSFKIPASFYEEINSSPDLKISDYKDMDGKSKPWEVTVFVETPLAGAVTNISRLKNEAINMGNAVVGKLQQSINADDIKIDRMVAMVNAPSSYIMSGSTYEADILLVAASSTANYQITVNGSNLAVTGGVGKYKAGASGASQNRVAGTIVLGDKTYPFAQEWTSFLPAATIAAEAMNVLYIGLQNPIAVSVPGVAPGNVTAVMSGGSMISKGAGKYEATVSAGNKEAIVSVTAKIGDGSSRPMGSTKFRIKRVPDPTPKLGTQTSGEASAGSLRFQGQVVVVLDNFPFDGVKYIVNSCEIMVMHRNKPPEFQKCPGGIIPGGGMKSIVPGDKVIVGNIRVSGPGKKNDLLSGNIVIDATQ